MKIHIFQLVLGLGCILSLSNAQCDLKDKKQDVDFPDMLKSVADTYIMGVEYSLPGAKQTDYYTEYYEVAFKRGRIESHIAGDNQIYIYQAETWEAWTISGKTCTLLNTTAVPDFFKDVQTNWLHYMGSDQPTTIGPSAMFKVAFDAWKVDKGSKMAYMGDFQGYIRGEQAVYWRRCIPTGGYVDYFFANEDEESAFDSDNLQKFSPLRVVFNGVSKNAATSKQVYDIISFQHVIPHGEEPFDLPRGRNCRRGPLVDGAVLPDFTDNNILLNAEAVYEKLDKDNDITSSYYSTLRVALDRESNHIAYYYSSWNTTKPGKETKEPFVNSLENIVYDIKHMYKYKINYQTYKCEISRDKSFSPQYRLPENGGNISLTDPYILFPNSELQFLSQGTDRGIPVDIFEAEIKNYILDKDKTIPRAVFSHSYLKVDEELENTVAVRYAPTQIESHLFREPDTEEVLTLNVFGFTTRITRRRRIFDVTPCFKNDDDYLYVTIGFEIENQYLKKIEKALPEIEENVLDQLFMKSELNPIRVPTVLTDFKDNYVYVTLRILGKPPLALDFPDMEKGKSVKTTEPEDSQGVANFDTCANNCLEERGDCWGFSVCGATCYYGSSKSTTVEANNDCTLYRRFSNETYMLSKESQANSIIQMVETGEFIVVAVIENQPVSLTATVAQIGDPSEGDNLFEKMGNLLNPRMRVVKAGSKLKKGSTVKNLGKLRYDECQSLCLDFQNCESLSYCLKNSECIISEKYESDIKSDDMESNNLCVLLSRKYTDNFDRTPGVFVEADIGTKKNIEKVEDCARACLKEDGFKCLSFDHCAGGDKNGCSLYKVHYLNSKDRKASVTGKNPRCGHYTRKYSTEFKKKKETRIVDIKVPVVTKLTLEECAKRCIEYGGGSCFGFDFCQDKTLTATSCTLIDSDPSRLKTTYSPICSNYLRTEPEYAPHPYTNSYAGGIGFLCFLVGGLIGAIIVFVIAYIRVNRRG